MEGGMQAREQLVTGKFVNMKQTTLWILIPLLMTIHQVNAQIDTVGLKSLMDEAINHVHASRFEDCIADAEKARGIASRYELWDQYYDMSDLILEAYERNYEIENAQSLLSKVLLTVDDHLGPDSYWKGTLLNHQAICHIRLSEFEAAKSASLEAIKVLEHHSDRGLKTISSIYANLGIIEGIAGNAAAEYDFYSKALEIQEKLVGPNSVKSVYLLPNLAVNLKKRALYQESLDLNNRVLQILKSNNLENYITVRVCGNISETYMILGEYELARDYARRSVKVYKKLFGEEGPESYFMYNNLANIMTRLSLVDSARYYFDKVFQDEPKMLLNDRPYTIGVYLELGNLERDAGNFDLALEVYQKALSASDYFGETSIYHAGAYMELGKLYELQDDWPTAIQYYEKSVETSYLNDPYFYDRMSLPLQKIASYLRATGSYDSALQQVNKSIAVNTDSTATMAGLSFPPLAAVVNLQEYLYSVMERVKVLKGMSSQNDTLQKHVAAHYEEIAAVTSKLRASKYSLNDRQTFQRKILTFYQEVVHEYLAEYLITGSEDQLMNAFRYLQATKSVLLTDEVALKAAKLRAGVPQAILDREADLRSDLSYYVSSIKEEESYPPDQVDKERLSNLQDQLFEANQSLDSLQSLLRADYPSFNAVNAGEEVADQIESLRDGLEKGEVLVDFFISDFGNYALIFTKKSFDAVRLSDEIGRNGLISQYRTDIANAEVVNDQQVQQLAAMSYELYQYLVAPIYAEVQEDIQKLTIVPDSELGYIPFETLLTEPLASGLISYKTFPYLINRVNVSYAYSSSLLGLGHENTLGEKLLSFAPSYDVSSEEDAVRSSLGRFRDAFVALKWNQQEAEDVEQYISGTAMTGKSATERAFKEQAADAKILHLAMHAFVDDLKPMNSKLVFFQDNDSTEDGFLHTFELYNMRLNADLAVLSACETGYGKLLKGEGISSLARGFSYAGVPSVVMSHWQVDDESTREIMNIFYRYLSQGETKSTALRKAKLEYLNEAGPIKGHPFYWGAFVVVGDDTPIWNDGPGIWLYVVLAVLALIVISILIRRNT